MHSSPRRAIRFICRIRSCRSRLRGLIAIAEDQTLRDRLVGVLWIMTMDDPCLIRCGYRPALITGSRPCSMACQQGISSGICQESPCGHT